MVVVRSLNEIILNLIDYFKSTQPDLDTKPGTVSRDLFIDAPASQLSILYTELGRVSDQQSIRMAVGTDLDKIGKNYGIKRTSPTNSSGIGLFTFNSIQAPIRINAGETVSASNGTTFKVLNTITISPSDGNLYRSLATKYRNDLDFLGIKDNYAAELTLQAASPGSSGNIPKYYLNRTDITAVSNVTNISPFNGGNDQEDDASYRNRILSVFGGSSTGTSLGYKNAALGVSGVADAFVVEPGDPLMSRDGTISEEGADGNLKILSEGTGGKVDVVVFGKKLTETVDTFIYMDKSNTNDPTDSKNNYVLGQIVGDEFKTINRKRIDNIKNGTLPSQPINNVFQVTGSLSGNNFQPKYIDAYGKVQGNYEIVKDTGPYGGSAFGFDTFRWISNKISLFSEDKIKGKSFSKDATTFTDVIEIPIVQQNISITNENSEVISSDRTQIRLFHTPSTNVTRVFNVTTGERYTVVNQNVSGNDYLNTSGIIKISGNTLPTVNDVLQVDYTWVVSYDQFVDYDGNPKKNKFYDNKDSIDWSYSNIVRNELVKLRRDSTGNSFSGKTKLPINSILNVSKYLELDATVIQNSSGNFAGRKVVYLSSQDIETNSVDSIKIKNTNTEIYNTSENNNFFTKNISLVGSGSNFSNLYETTIVLPSDAQVNDKDIVSVFINVEDVFNNTGSPGTYALNSLTIPSINANTTSDTINVMVSYIADNKDILGSSISSLPISKSGNSFIFKNINTYAQPNKSSLLRREHQKVYQDISGAMYVNIDLSPLDVSISEDDIVSIIRLSDGKELWNSSNVGTITQNPINFNFNLKLTRFNSPKKDDYVIVFYYCNDTNKIQPFFFQNRLIEKNIHKISADTSGKFWVNIRKFEPDSGVKFRVFNTSDDSIYLSGDDADINPYTELSTGNTAEDIGELLIKTIFETSFDFNLADFNGKKITISNSKIPNNNNTYDIIGFDNSRKILKIKNNINSIVNTQISVIRLADGKELWNAGGKINFTLNRLEFTALDGATFGDDVFVTYHAFSAIKKSPTKLSINISDQYLNPGNLSIIGTTVFKVTDAIFSPDPSPTKSNSFRQNISYLIKSHPAIKNNQEIKKYMDNNGGALPPSVRLIRISKLDRVSTVNSSIEEVVSVNGSYDLFGTSIKDNLFYSDDFNCNQNLDAFEFVLPNTSNNNIHINSGDKLRITFYFAIDNDIENVIIPSSGSYYTNKTFATIDGIYASSGFNSSTSTRMNLSYFNQPSVGSRYKVFYDYLAPKPNERITIKYYYNSLISDTTFAIENNRPINSDVLVREAKEIPIDITLNVVISNTFAGSASTVIQNLKDKITSAINSSSLGSTVYYSNMINIAFSVEGVSNARIIIFNKSGNIGQKLSIKAKSDEYFVANNVVIKREYK